MENIYFFFLFKLVYIYFVFICIAISTTSLIKNVTKVLREMILTLVYFHKMAQLLISPIAYNTVTVLEIHLTSPLWFMAIESLTDKQSQVEIP